MATSKSGLPTIQKVQGSHTYRPMVLSDDNVYHLAQHYYTAEEIAERFKITRMTLLDLHGDAFNAGKDEAKNLPRFALQKIIKDFMQDGVNFARSDVPVNNLLKAIELHAKKYEGLGSTQTIITQNEDKPSVSSIKFVPLTKDNL